LLTAQEPVPLSVSHPGKINANVSKEIDHLVASLTAMEVDQRILSAEDAKKQVLAILANSAAEEAPQCLTV
jgi:hypothetical protein